MTCIAPHVAALKPGHEAINWQEPHPDGRTRSVKWTCDCRPVVYEMCRSGGLYFLRRSTDGTCSGETSRAIWATVERLWTAILCGMAR